MTLTRLLLFCLLVVMVGCNDDQVRRLERENQELAAKLDAVAKATNLDLQKKCADEANAMFKELGWNKKPFASYNNHYQQKLNKCFIRIEDREVEKQRSYRVYKRFGCF